LGARSNGRGGQVNSTGRVMPTRTAKSCGPDTPTLVSSLAEFFRGALCFPGRTVSRTTRVRTASRERDAMGQIRSVHLTNFWHCRIPHFSSRTAADAPCRQRTVKGFGRGSGFQKGLAMLIRSQMYGVHGSAANAARSATIPAASAPTLLIGGLLLLICP
jgi:hypothetical protein